MTTRLSRLCGSLLFVAAMASLSSAGSATDPLPEGAIFRMGSCRLAHGTWLTCVRFSEHDRWVGAADADGGVRLWDVATGQLVWQKQREGCPDLREDSKSWQPAPGW
jgi:WD40 repeat protein